MPSEEIGEYEKPRRRSAPGGSSRRPPGGGLFPLSEEGHYGPPPTALPGPLPGYQRRERKPKVYASYAVSSDCDLHSSKLEKNENDRGLTPRRKTSTTSRPSSRASSVTSASSRPSSSLSMSSSRSRTKSSSPERIRQESSAVPKRRSVSIDNLPSRNNKINNTGFSHIKNIAREVKNQNGFNSNKYRSTSFSKVSRDLRELSFEEDEEYEYDENNIHDEDKSDSRGSISLSSIREPTFNYDSLGVLGLSSLMWSKAEFRRQQSFLSNSAVLRKTSVSSQAV